MWTGVIIKFSFAASVLNSKCGVMRTFMKGLAATHSPKPSHASPARAQPFQPGAPSRSELIKIDQKRYFM